MAQTGKASSRPAPHGRVVGRYLMFGQIGAGGTATVHFGRLRAQGGFSRTVALKRLHPHLARDPYFVSLFLSEARLAGRVSHPNVTSLLDVVQLEDGELFLVMDYVHGETLAGLLGLSRRREAAIPPRIATGIIVGALLGLHAAHESIGEDGRPLGLVHGDVSPHNIIVGADGSARVLDFGVARAGAASSKERRVIGTLAYMAPERLRGAAFDCRSDVFGAAVLLWEMLAMRRLFSGCDGRSARALAQLPPPSRFCPGIPGAIDDVVLWGLQAEKNDRPVDALAYARALEGAVSPATSPEIAAWLQLTAGQRLRERSDELSRIERSSVAPLLQDEWGDFGDVPTTAANLERGLRSISATPAVPAPSPHRLESPFEVDDLVPGEGEPTICDQGLAAAALADLIESAAPAPAPVLSARKADPQRTPILPLTPRVTSSSVHSVATPRSPTPPPRALSDELVASVVPARFDQRIVLAGLVCVIIAAGTAFQLGRGNEISTPGKAPDLARARIGDAHAAPLGAGLAPAPTASAPAPAGLAAALPPTPAAAPVPATPATAPVPATPATAPVPAAPATAPVPATSAVAPVPAAPATAPAPVTPTTAAVPVTPPTAPAAPAAPAAVPAPPPAPLAPVQSPAAFAAAGPAATPPTEPEQRPAPTTTAATIPVAAPPAAPVAAPVVTASPGFANPAPAAFPERPRPARPQVALRQEILALNRHAIAAYDALDPERALRDLTQALALCREPQPGATALAALTHMHLGVVLAGGFKQHGLAVRHFRKAHALDPFITPDADVSSPEIAAAVRAANPAHVMRAAAAGDEL